MSTRQRQKHRPSTKAKPATARAPRVSVAPTRSGIAVNAPQTALSLAPAAAVVAAPTAAPVAATPITNVSADLLPPSVIERVTARSLVSNVASVVASQLLLISGLARLEHLSRVRLADGGFIANLPSNSTHPQVAGLVRVMRDLVRPSLRGDTLPARIIVQLLSGMSSAGNGGGDTLEAILELWPVPPSRQVLSGEKLQRDFEAMAQRTNDAVQRFIDEQVAIAALASDLCVASNYLGVRIELFPLGTPDTEPRGALVARILASDIALDVFTRHRQRQANDTPNASLSKLVAAAVLKPARPLQGAAAHSTITDQQVRAATILRQASMTQGKAIHSWICLDIDTCVQRPLDLNSANAFAQLVSSDPQRFPHQYIWGGLVRVGRDSTCEVRCRHPSVSGVHCIIRCRSGIASDREGGTNVVIQLEDLSTHGTFVNGQRVVTPIDGGRDDDQPIEQRRMVDLADGDVITLVRPSASMASTLGDSGQECEQGIGFRFLSRPETSARIQPEGTLEDKYEVDWKTNLGSGSFATIHRCRSIATDRKFAVKVVDKQKSRELMSRVDGFMDEVDALRVIQHPSILRLHDVIETATQICLVTDLAEGGDLLTRVLKRKSRGMNEERAKRIFRQLQEAVRYMHSKGVVHRDLKLENILLMSSSSDEVRIADFGLSRILLADGRMRTSCGTEAYQAPEVPRLASPGEILHDSQESQPVASSSSAAGVVAPMMTSYDGDYGKAIDQWSLGCVLFSTLTGSAAFGQGQINRILAGDFIGDGTAWKRVPMLARSLIEQLLTVDPQRRATAEKALAHPWLAVESSRSSASLSAPLDVSSTHYRQPLDQLEPQPQPQLGPPRPHQPHRRQRQAQRNQSPDLQSQFGRRGQAWAPNPNQASTFARPNSQLPESVAARTHELNPQPQHLIQPPYQVPMVTPRTAATPTSALATMMPPQDRPPRAPLLKRAAPPPTHGERLVRSDDVNPAPSKRPRLAIVGGIDHSEGGGVTDQPASLPVTQSNQLHKPSALFDLRAAVQRRLRKDPHCVLTPSDFKDQMLQKDCEGQTTSTQPTRASEEEPS